MPSLPEIAVEILLFIAMLRSHRFKEDWSKEKETIPMILR
jgi:hypothetical protein